MLRRWNIEIAPDLSTMNHLLNAMIKKAVRCFAMVDHWLWTSPWRNVCFSPPKILLALLFFVYDFAFLSAVNAGTVISFDTVCESLFWLLKKKQHLQVFQLPSTLPWFLQKNPPRTWILWWFSVDFIPRCWALVGLQPRMRVWKSLALEFQGKNLQKNVRWRGAFSMKVYRLDSLQPCQVNLMFLALEMSISITLKYSQLQ